MRGLTKEELDSILADHKFWLKSGCTKGKQADLHDANLCEANLHDANLHDANLHDANLCGADLRVADLRGARLDGANLCGANLCEADLHDANLRGARLDGANLCGADLRVADLRVADLRGARLDGANLCGANLCGADIDFSCLPLWCGSLSAHFDDRQLRQIAYHLVKAGLQSKNASPETKAELVKLIDFANGFHRVKECGMIEKPEAPEE